MPIVSSIVAQVMSEPRGRERVREVHTDHNGKKWTKRYKTTAGLDHTLLLTAHAVEVLKAIKKDEREMLQHRLEEGADPASVPLVHLTKRQSIKPIIRAFMATDPQAAMLLVKHLRDNFTNAELDLELPVAVRQKVRQRITGILSMETALEDDKGLIVEVPE